MVSYVEAINRLERERNALHDAVRATFLFRDKAPLARRDWEIAAEKFRSHGSSLDPLIESCFRGSQDTITPDIRDFIFDYIIVDPQFFRSGYLMERILRKIKRLFLSADEKLIIQNLLLTRVRVKALRNFRHICRLIPMVEDAELRAEVEELTHSQDAAIRHRATFAFTYFQR